MGASPDPARRFLDVRDLVPDAWDATLFIGGAASGAFLRGKAMLGLAVAPRLQAP